MDQRQRDFARNVRAQMGRKSMTTAILATKAGIAPKTLNNILAGRHKTQFNNLTAIADALDVDLWQLFLPDFPADLSADDTFPRLIETVAKIKPNFLGPVVDFANYQLSQNPREK